MFSASYLCFENLSWNVFQAALEQKCLTEMSDFMINISN